MIERAKSATANTLSLPVSANRVLILMATTWLLAVTALALSETRSYWATLSSLGEVDPERSASLRFTLGLVVFSTTWSVVIGWLLPAWWRRGVLALALGPAALAIATSHNEVAVLVGFCLLAPVVWWGRETATRLLSIADSRDAWAVGSGLGLVFMLALSITLVACGVLRPLVVWFLLLLLTLVLVGSPRSRDRYITDVTSLKGWLARPTARRIDVFAIVGLLLGVFWLALIGALAPEFMSDAVRIRLPTAEFFAREGRLAFNPDIRMTASPGLGELFNATVLAIGPLEAAKIVNFLVFLLCCGAVWNIGRHLGGNYAALLALLVFATIPLTVFQAQIAYLDLLTVLLAATAALVLVLRPTDVTTVVVVMVCILSGFAIKQSFIFAAAGLTVSLGLLILNKIDARLNRLSALAMLLGLLAGSLWVTGSYAALSSVPTLLPIVTFLQHARDTYVGVVPELGANGSGRTVPDLVRLPLDLVQHTERFGEYQPGFVGFLLLGLLPLIFVVRTGRGAGSLALGIATAFLLWFAVAQYVRYSLPMFALLAGLGAASFASLVERNGTQGRLVPMALAPALAALSLLGYLNTILVYPGDVPYKVVLGQQSKTDYLTEHVGAYTALRLLDSEPAATRAWTAYDYARLYTHVPLNDTLIVAPSAVTSDPVETLFAAFDQNGFSHIVIDRDLLLPNWDSAPIFDEEILRRNTQLVGGDHNAYLYRILPPDERGDEHEWAKGHELLLNGSFEESSDGTPQGWTSNGKVRFVTSGRGYQTPRDAVRLGDGSALFATVPVVPGTRYLLSHATRSIEEYGQARLQINWLTESGIFAGVTIEVVPTSPKGYHQFSMLATAPPDATQATVVLQTQSGEAFFDDVSLKPFDANPGPVDTSP